MYVYVQLHFMHVLGGLMMDMLNDAYNLYIGEDCKSLLWRSYSLLGESRLLNTLHCITYHNIVLDFLYYLIYNPFWQLLTQLVYCAIIYVQLQVFILSHLCICGKYLPNYLGILPWFPFVFPLSCVWPQYTILYMSISTRRNFSKVYILWYSFSII